MLKDKALQMLTVLETIISALNKFEGGENLRAQSFLKKVSKHYDNYKEALESSKDKAVAQKALKYLKPIVTEINHLQSKGGFPITTESIYNKFFQLANIFQDKRYINEDI